MFILRKGQTCFISKIEEPHKIWYHINLDIPRYGDDYVRSKLGVTDSIQQRDIRIEFYEAIRNNNIRTDELKYHILRLDKTDYAYYTHQVYSNVVTVFIEKGLFTLDEHYLQGNPWAIICQKDTPEQIQAKLYDHRKRFGEVMHKKLQKICGW
ncbi:MAG: hypothetical protein J7K40_01285 [candidate division Zixibacteria bacterium]|nr:hypothetical protein [candidate division Zixibacteria bacterium]